MEKIIITGADGFLGSHLIKKCLEKKIEVWAIVRPIYKNINRIKDLKNINFIYSDIDKLYEKIDEFPKDIDTFYHLAWNGVHVDMRNNIDVQLENINLCINAIKFASCLNIKRFILPGSTNEYLYYGKPIDEQATPSPIDAYGTIKVITRYLCQLYANKYNIGFIYAIITGIYSADRKDNNVIYYSIKKLLRKEKPILTKLEQKWDYIHINDAVEAMYLLGISGKPGVIYTIGKGDNQPLKKYIQIIRNNINPLLPLGIGEIDYLSEKIPSSCVDLTAIKRDTDFNPKIEFEEGIKEVINTLKKEII